MKKFIILSALTIVAISSLEAWRGCANGSCARPVQGCATTCAKQACAEAVIIEEPCAPICTKVVEVPAKKIVIPTPDLIERVPQPAKQVRIPQPALPQPDLIKFEQVPDLVRRIPQAPCVRWECPAGTTATTNC